MTTYEQAKLIIESYGFKERKEGEFLKLYSRQKWRWSVSVIDEVEVTILIESNGEYNTEDISILNDMLDYDEIEGLTGALEEVQNDIENIQNEISDINFEEE